MVRKRLGPPIGIAWEIHGSGPTKIVVCPPLSHPPMPQTNMSQFIMGLGGVKTAWQRQTKYFGHDRSETYSVLILDNRGVGESDKPTARYTTMGMARDVIQVLDALGWTGLRELNLVGVSLGGMIAQEIAHAIPMRLMSLSLLCTTASLESSKSFQATVAERAGLFVPKSLAQNISGTAGALFTPEWLAAPDEEILPEPGVTPRCNASRPYLHFDSNFQRFQAQELTKRLNRDMFTGKGLICQVLAGGGHRKSDGQLREIAERVGRERILVVHGTRDKMMDPVNGARLIRVLRPGVGLLVDGLGHAPMMERAGWFNSLLEERLIAWGKIRDGEEQVGEAAHI